MAKRWTEGDIVKLKEMAQRYPTPKIAELMDRSVGSVVFKAHCLKISLRSRRQIGNGTMDPGASGFEMQE